MRWKAWSSISVAIFWRYMVYRFQEKYKQHRERCRERYRPPTWSRFWISRASGRDFNQPSNTCSWRQIPPIIVKFTRRNTRDYIFSRNANWRARLLLTLVFLTRIASSWTRALPRRAESYWRRSKFLRETFTSSSCGPSKARPFYRRRKALRLRFTHSRLLRNLLILKWICLKPVLTECYHISQLSAYNVI